MHAFIYMNEKVSIKVKWEKILHSIVCWNLIIGVGKISDCRPLIVYRLLVLNSWNKKIVSMRFNSVGGRIFFHPLTELT
jgi:hypothetical protein